MDISSAPNLSSVKIAPAWKVAAGNFLFRYRNALFPVILTFLVVFTRPDLFDNPTLFKTWITLGAWTAILGEMIRLLTIGYDYIDRGGRDGKVYASRLVQGGIYAHVRNPMYVGNLLMAAGLGMYSASLAAFMIVVVFFTFAYLAITAAEEAFLAKKFGSDYQAYCDDVPRFVPRLTGLASRLKGMAFEWKTALRKDYGNLYFLTMSLIILSGWRDFFLEELDLDEIMPTRLLATAISTMLYFGVMALKKAHRLG